MTIGRDFYNNTPLHHAAANGYTKSMTLLLNIHCYLLDTQNRLGVSISLCHNFLSRCEHSQVQLQLLIIKRIPNLTENSLIFKHFYSLVPDTIRNFRIISILRGPTMYWRITVSDSKWDAHSNINKKIKNYSFSTPKFWLEVYVSQNRQPYDLDELQWAIFSQRSL